MALQDDVATVALVVSLVALIVSFVQLLTTLLSADDGFKRTNRATLGSFVETKQRIFHPSELRIETTFSTPHFTFDTAAAAAGVFSSSSSQIEYDESSEHRDIISKKPGQTNKTQLLHLTRDGCKALPGFLRSNVQLSRYQSLRNAIARSFSADENVLIRTNDRPYAAGWLILIEQLCAYDSIYYESSTGVTYLYRSNNLNVFDPAILHSPAIRCERRSWDLQPPAVFRPLATIELRDLLTICFRLRIRVEEYKHQVFRASGGGHTFSPLTVQGAGLVVEYHYNASASSIGSKFPGNTLFAPSEATDQLAFGIIPSNLALGISRSWDLQQSGDTADSMVQHWEALGVLEKYRRVLRSSPNPDSHETRDVYGDSVYMLAPILSVDGLGIVKYRHPLSGAWSSSMMVFRESRIALRTRLNELRENHTSAIEDEQTIFVSDILNKLAEWEIFWSSDRMFHQFDRNAETEYQHEKLDFLRINLKKADEFLCQTCGGEYTKLVAAHIEMAIEVLREIKQLVREKKYTGFRTDNTIKNFSSWISEANHRYIDAALGGKIAERYRSKAKGLALSDQQIREAWFTMIFRAILWQACHHAIPIPWLPYESNFYRDQTLIMIA